MKRILAVSAAVLLALVLTLALGSQAYAQETKPAGKTALDRVMGIVQRVDKATSTIEVKDANNIVRLVTYTDKTVFTKAHAAGGGIGDIEQGTKLTCVGKFEAANKLVASKINIREPKK